MKIIKTAVLLSALVLTCSAVSCEEYVESSESRKSKGILPSITTTEAVSETESESESESTSETESNTEESSEPASVSSFINDTTPEPAMWKVTDPATGNSINLIGTLHILDLNEITLPDYILEAYDECEGVAVEYDMSDVMSDTTKMQELASYLIYTDGSKVTDHISKEAYENGKKLLEDANAYNPIYDSYKAGAWLDLIQSAASSNVEGVKAAGFEGYFTDKCRADGKEVVNIESLKIQAEALTAYSDDYADYLIKNYKVEDVDPETQNEQLKFMYDKWATGDIDCFVELFTDNSQVPDDLKDDQEDFNNKMLFDRNKGMAEKASEYLKEGKQYFFMVGSAHYAGDKGVDDLLKDMGYEVERVA